MRPPEELSVVMVADALLDLRRSEAPHVGATLCVHRRRFRRALVAETMDRRDLDFTLGLALDFLWAHSEALRASRLRWPDRPIVIAAPSATAAFLEAAEAQRRAPSVARAVQILNGLEPAWRRGHYLRRRVEFLKLDAARRGLTEREVRLCRFAYVSEIARQRAPWRVATSPDLDL